MLVGAVGMFDLRLLGMAKRVPINALHRLIRGAFGDTSSLSSPASCFCNDGADQCIYSPRVSMEVSFMLIAGLNVATFIW